MFAVPLAVGSTLTTPDADTVTSGLSLVHVTACGAKLVVATSAVNVSTCPADTVAVAGDTVTPVTVGVFGINAIAFANGETLNSFHT